MPCHANVFHMLCEWFCPKDKNTGGLDGVELPSETSLFHRRLEPTSKALAAERQDLVVKYEAAEKPQASPRIQMEIQPGSLTSAVPAVDPAPFQPPTESRPAKAALQEAVISSNAATSPTRAPQQKQESAPGVDAADAATAERTPSPKYQKGSGELGQAASSKENVKVLVPKASTRSKAEGALEPVSGQHAQAKSTAASQKEPDASLAPRSAKGADLRGGFLGSALAGKLSKQVVPSEAQPAAQTDTGQQQSSAASSHTQNGSATAEEKSNLQGGFLGRALAGKSKPAAAAIAPIAAKTEATQAMGQSPDTSTPQGPASHGTLNGTAAPSKSEQNGAGKADTSSSEAAVKTALPSPALPSTAENADEVPAEKSTAAALEVAQRALAARQATLRTPTSGISPHILNAAEPTQRPARSLYRVMWGSYTIADCPSWV